jgi:NADPH:quinone reductase-like Zn-dependent oxidoreductase
MRVKAAVAFEANRPLEIEMVDLEGPREGEVLVEIKATGVCHTDALALSGRESDHAHAHDPRPRRGRDCGGNGAWRELARTRGPRDSLSMFRSAAAAKNA